MTTEGLEARRAKLLADGAAALARGDMQALIAIGAEAKKLEGAARTERDTAETGARETLKASIVKALQGLDLRQALRDGTITATVKRTDTGFDDVRVAFLAPGLMDLIVPAVESANPGAVASVKRIEVELKHGKADVKVLTGGSTKAGGSTKGNGGAKGWYKDGVRYELKDVYEAHATEEDRASFAQAAGDGSKQYAVKVKVAKREGYTKGG